MPGRPHSIRPHSIRRGSTVRDQPAGGAALAAQGQAIAVEEPPMRGPGGPGAIDQADETGRDRCPVQETAVARRLPPRGRPAALMNRARCPARRAAPSPATTPDAALGAGAHPPRNSERRDTADEAKSHR